MLALMRLGEDAYGVPISREIEKIGGREVALGSVYAALERLEVKGFRNWVTPLRNEAEGRRGTSTSPGRDYEKSEKRIAP